MMYLIDSNTFITAKNDYYRFTFCPAFWDWIEDMASKGVVQSIEPVRDELLKGNNEDFLFQWSAHRESMFLPVDDLQTQSNYQEIMGYLKSESVKMKQGALSDFIKGADPWLIAKAKHLDATIVTLEQYNPEIKRKFLIPNVCKEFKVSYIDTYTLLENLNAKFVL